jgi:hypothetical protein
MQNISILRDKPCLTGEFRQETHNETAGVKQDYNRLSNQDYAPFVYRLGRRPFKAQRPVRFWYGVPSMLCGYSSVGRAVDF